MNFAFPALFIFLLALPGLVFRYAYNKGTFGHQSPVSFRTTTDEIGKSVLLSGILHGTWCLVLSAVGYHIDWESAFVLLTGAYGKDDEYLSVALASFSQSPFEVVVYFLFLYAASWRLGKGLHIFVRRFHLDWKFRGIFRFNNEWWYRLRGEDFRVYYEIPLDALIDTYIAAVVEFGNEVYLYRGILWDFDFDRAGNLDHIFLVDTHRRPLSEDRPAGRKYRTKHRNKRFYTIEGDRFALRYGQIKTINLEYVILIPE